MANYQQLINYASIYTRRAFIKTGLASATGLALTANFSGYQIQRLAASNQPLAPTPNCDDDDYEPTQPNAEGPFYTPDTPERSVLVGSDEPGTPLLVTGRVLNTECQPIAGALLDFWHTDDAGNYDNEGFTFRGHQYADSEGNYRLETILPGLYPGRTRHIHVKVAGPNDPTLLTTQLYFAGDPSNESDGLILPSLIIAVVDQEDGSKAGAFDFVLDYAVAEVPASQGDKIYFPLIARS